MLYLVIEDGQICAVADDPQEARRMADLALEQAGEDGSVAVFQVAAEQVHTAAPEAPPAPPPPPPPPPKPPNNPPAPKPRPGMRRVPNAPRQP